MKDFQYFYGTKAWKQTRDAYIKSVGGWCELCKAKGEYTQAEIVHHKIHLNEKNINNANLSLSFDNLQALCRNCHAEVHARSTKRYKVDKNGNVIIRA